MSYRAPQIPETVLRARYPLDAVRALAAVGILAFHAYQNNKFVGTDTYPWTGFLNELMLSSDAVVDLFFVLSGFVLYLPIARASLQRQPQRPARVLLLRRIARLVPLYLVVVIVVWSINNRQLPAHWSDLFLHLTFTQVYSNHYIFWTVGPGWSLAVEFHFYVLLAVSVPVLARWNRRVSDRRALLVGVLALPALMTVAGIAWLTWAIYLDPQSGDAWSVWFGPLANAPIFALGLFLAVLVAAGKKVTQRRHRVVLGCAAAAVVLVGTLIRSSLPGQTSQWLSLIFGIAAAVFVANIVMTDGPPMRWLNWRPLVRLGIVSYSVYLLHEPVMRLARAWGVLPTQGSNEGIAVTFVVVLGATIALSLLSYPLIEQYGLKLLDMFGPDGRPRRYYDHLPETPRPNRRPEMRIAWVPEGEPATVADDRRQRPEPGVGGPHAGASTPSVQPRSGGG